MIEAKETIGSRLNHFRDVLTTQALVIENDDAFSLQNLLDALRDDIINDTLELLSRNQDDQTTKVGGAEQPLEPFLEFMAIPRKAVITWDSDEHGIPMKVVEWEFCVKGALKLYDNTETGNTWIAHHDPSTGVRKMNLVVRGNVRRMTKVLRTKKNGGKIGTVGFFARATTESYYEQYALTVNADDLEVLFDSLVGMGAEII